MAIDTNSTTTQSIPVDPVAASESHFGEHLMIDGYAGSVALLDDRDVVARILD